MNDKAPFLEFPNEPEKMAHAKPYYGNQHVPHPCNERAKKVDHAKVMEQVRKAK